MTIAQINKNYKGFDIILWFDYAYMRIGDNEIRKEIKIKK